MPPSSNLPDKDKGSSQQCNCDLFTSPVKTFSDIENRMMATEKITPTLEIVGKNIDKWIFLYRCKVCGAYWADFEYGDNYWNLGHPCYCRVELDDPQKWLASAENIADDIRLRYDDRRFFDSLSPEVGPEKCRTEGCERKCIKFSVMCKIHHFEMIKKRPYRG